MKKWFSLLCMMMVLGFVSSSFGIDPILIGNFEDSISNDRYDNWLSDFEDTPSFTGATLGAKSLQLVDADGGWGATFTKPFGEYGNTIEGNTYYQALLNPGAVLAIDVTAFPGEVPDNAASLALFANADGHWGDFPNTGQQIIVDGLPHTYVYPMTAEAVTALENADGGWGYNLGWLLSTGDASATFYVDNIWIYPEGPINVFGPYNPWDEQDFNVDPAYVDFTLHWFAGQDPGGHHPDPNIVYPVNPEIVDEYVFISNGSDTDPNVYYLGATGVDPGNTDPNSEYGPVVLPINSVYYWAVVEAMEGSEQTLTVGVSTLDDMDPNNIVGPVWTFPTLSTVPEIDTQPVSARFGINDASAQFTIDVTSNTPPSYQWFYSLDPEIDAGDNAISPTLGGDTDTLSITAHNKAYQAYYYCRVANASTVSGGLGGTEPDVYSDVVSLVVERKVADYQFDGNLTDAGDGNDGTGVGSPSFVTGVGGSGSALSLDGSEDYVEIGSSTDPNTFNKCFPRADLLTEGGIGGGLDVGTIMCWVQLDSTVADQISPIMYNGNEGWPHTEFVLNVTTDSAAENTNLQSHIWGEALDAGGNPKAVYWMDINPVYADPFDMGGDGQWHMLALTWDMNGSVKAYMDGNLLAVWDASGSNIFSAWDSILRIGFDGTNYFGGLIDNLRVYNYEVAAEDIAQEYFDVTGESGCIYQYFDGSSFNADDTGSSYCKVDLADFAVFASNWLNDGFYTPAP